MFLAWLGEEVISRHWRPRGRAPWVPTSPTPNTARWPVTRNQQSPIHSKITEDGRESYGIGEAPCEAQRHLGPAPMIAICGDPFSR